MSASALIPAPEVARRLGISMPSFQRMVRRGDFPSALLVGQRSKRWAEKTVEAWISEAEKTVGASPSQHQPSSK